MAGCTRPRLRRAALPAPVQVLRLSKELPVVVEYKIEGIGWVLPGAEEPPPCLFFACGHTLLFCAHKHTWR